jgi:hypothetical protein
MWITSIIQYLGNNYNNEWGGGIIIHYIDGGKYYLFHPIEFYHFCSRCHSSLDASKPWLICTVDDGQLQQLFSFVGIEPWSEQTSDAMNC